MTLYTAFLKGAFLLRSNRHRWHLVVLSTLLLVMARSADAGEHSAAHKMAADAEQRPRHTLPPRRAGRRVQARPSGNISLKFVNSDVGEVLDQIAKYAHTEILLTPGATGPVSISIRNRTPEAAIRLTAAAAGLTVANTGGIYLVGPAAEIKKAIAEFGQSVVVPLRFITPAEAADVLGRVMPTVRVEPSKSAVVLTGLPADLASARNALGEVDAPTAQELSRHSDTVSVRYADPENSQRVLQEAIPDLKITRLGNTLVLNGTSTELEAATHTLQTLDVEPPKVAEPQEVLVYHLRYVNALRAEESLKKALPDLNVTVAPEPNAPPAANFNPLSTSFLGGGNNGGVSFGGNGGGVGGGAGGANTNGGNGVSGASAQPLSRSTRLILIGVRSDVEKARQLLEQTDVKQPSVRIEAMLVEINSEAFKNLGINWDFTRTGFTFIIPNGRRLDFGTIQHGGPNPQNPNTPASFTASLQALVTQNHAHILARPNISVVDNEDASIFIGDLRRFPGATIISPNVGTVQAVETIPVGIALLVRPRIDADGDVTLKVHPVVSNVSAIVNGLPQTSSREADTTVRLHEGEELVIGGLDRSDTTSSLQKVPLLGDIPIIGELFRTRTHDVVKSEIVVLIRAYPVLTDQAPPHDFRRPKEEK